MQSKQLLLKPHITCVEKVPQTLSLLRRWEKPKPDEVHGDVCPVVRRESVRMAV